MKAHSRRNFLKYLFAAFIFFSVVGVGQHAWAATLDLNQKYRIESGGTVHTPDPDAPGYFSSYLVQDSNGNYTRINGSDYKLLESKGLFDTSNAQTSVAMTETTVTANPSLDYCEWEGTWPHATVYGCFVRLLYLILWVASLFVGFAGLLFGWVFDFTVVNMKANIGGIEVIGSAWRVVRDLANIFFIFILLYLAIVTILQLDEHGVRHSLSRLIIAAVLINFSLFFVKVIIDVPNILSIKIYNAAVPESGTGNGKLGNAFLQIFNPQQSFSIEDRIKAVKKGYSKEDAIKTEMITGGNLGKNPLTTFAMGIVLMAVATFVFLAVIIIFLKRFVILIFLMCFAPLAFLGMALPIHAAEGKAKQFWETLFKEAFYAPIFMLCVLITLRVGRVLNDPKIVAASGLNTDFVNISNIISYSVVIVMLVASLIIAEEMAVSGASGAMTAYNGMKGAALGAVGGGAKWAGMHTVGRLASTWINSKAQGATMGDTLRDVAGGKGKGKFAKSWVGQSLAKAVVASADKAGKGFDEHTDKQREWMEAAISNRHGDHQFVAEIFAQSGGKGATSVDRKVLDNQLHHMSIEQKANTQEYLKEMAEAGSVDAEGNAYSDEQRAGAQASLKRYFGNRKYGGDGHGRLEADEVADIERTTAKGITFFDRKFKHAVEHNDHDEVSKFLENATEGQALSAIRSLGASGTNFKSGPMRLALIQGLKKFKGEAFLSTFAKDDALDENIKSAGSDSGYDTKVTWDLSEALLADVKNRTGTMIGRFKTKLAALKNKEINDALLDYTNTNDLDALIDKYQSLRSGDEVTRNYMDSTNGQRSQVKSAHVIDELNDLVKEKDTAGGSAVGYPGTGSRKYIRP